MKEMIGGCCVCGDERGWDENPLVYCDGHGCNVAVHQACYGIVTVPTGPWFCRKCESQERAARVRCELCPQREGALKRTDSGSWAHVVCALYIPEVCFANVSTMEPILLTSVPHDRYSKVCCLCETKGRESKASMGACMTCNKNGCRQAFHVTCAQQEGLLCEEAGQYNDNVKYTGYCSLHYTKLRKDKDIKTIPPFRPLGSSYSTPEKDKGQEKPKGEKDKCRQKPERKAKLSETGPSSSQESLSTNTPGSTQSSSEETPSKFTNANFTETVLVTNEEQSSAGSGDNSLILKFKRNSVSQVTQRGRKSSRSASSNAGSPMRRNSDCAVGTSVGEFSLSFGERGAAATSPSQSNDETASVKSGKSKKSSSREPSRTPTPSTTPSATPSATPTVITETLMEQNLPLTSENSENTDNPSEGLKKDSDEENNSAGAANNTPGKTYESSFEEFMARYEKNKKDSTTEEPKLSECGGHEEAMDTGLVNGGKEKEDSPVEKIEEPEKSSNLNQLLRLKNYKIEKHERKKHRSARRSKEGKASKVGRPRSSLRSGRTGDDMPVKRARQSSGSMPNSPTGVGLLNSSYPGTMVADGATYGFATQGGQGSSISPGGLSALFHAAGCVDAGRTSNKLTDEAATIQDVFSTAGQSGLTIGPQPRSTLTHHRPAMNNPVPVGASMPATMEQLLERQWEQGSNFLMAQATHLDIASLLSCLHQLRQENQRLEENVTSLLQRRDHLLAVSARLSLPLVISGNSPRGLQPGGGHNNRSSESPDTRMGASSRSPRINNVIHGDSTAAIAASLQGDLNSSHGSSSTLSSHSLNMSHQSLNHSLNQSINQSPNQSLNQSSSSTPLSQSLNHSLNQSGSHHLGPSRPGSTPSPVTNRLSPGARRIIQ
ncbi:LOW QUALITY PROTEIN: uncharacterized protein [Amphiura filiformis]|uniref:LOW QUALITY PROTEIN: uncharacterized protein n=1 Tax=Amphiura filiformis TaxID=82378 RepID=UPI003B223155